IPSTPRSPSLRQRSAGNSFSRSIAAARGAISRFAKLLTVWRSSSPVSPRSKSSPMVIAVSGWGRPRRLPGGWGAHWTVVVAAAHLPPQWLQVLPLRRTPDDEDPRATSRDRGDADRLRTGDLAGLREVRRRPGGGPPESSDPARAARRPRRADHRAPARDVHRGRHAPARRRGARLVL